MADRRTPRQRGISSAATSFAAGELIADGTVGSALVTTLERAAYKFALALIDMMIVILVVGIVVDAVLFGSLDRWVRRRHGLLGD